MPPTRELARLLGMGRPTALPHSLFDAIEDPSSYSHQIRKGAFTSGGARHWVKSASFESPEVDFKALRTAGRAEPLFRRRANRYQNLVWKNGYVLKTEDERAKAYIQSRMEVFAILTGESFDSFLRKVSRELIMFDNCVIWERRVKLKDLKKLGITLNMRGIGPLAVKGPVVAYEILPIDTLQYKRDEYGNVTAWRQVSSSGEHKDYSPEEIILLKNDEESGDILAYPALQMVLPDARILRQLETDASLTAHRLAFPIFKYKVGNPSVAETLPTEDDDLSDIWFALEGMLLEGALIISGADEFEVVLSDVQMDGLSNILDYFKNRVIVGLGLSPHHLGDVGIANRSVADRLDVQLYDDVKAFQKTMSEAATFFIFFRWLMEGGFPLRLGGEGLSESRVALEFREIDTDALIKFENHKLQLWVQDGISHAEFRSDLGLTPTEDMSDFYSSKVGAITAKYQQMVDQSKAQATSGGANQQTNAKTRATKTSMGEMLTEVASFRELVGLFKEEAFRGYNISPLDEIWNRLEADIVDYVRITEKPISTRDLGYLSALYLSDLEDAVRMGLVQSLQVGLDRGFDEARAIDPDIAPMRVTLFNRHANNILRSLRYYLEKLLGDLAVRVEKETNESETPELGIEVAFEALHYRLDSVVSTHLALADNWGVCMVARHAGYDRVWQDSEPGCSICTGGWVGVDGLEPKGVPPFSTHPHCGCKVHIKHV